MSTAPEDREGPWSDRITRYSRDVLVNVAGNLVTAAVIYLAGAAFGLLPRSIPLIVLSVAVVLAGLYMLLFVATQIVVLLFAWGWYRKLTPEQKSQLRARRGRSRQREP